MVICPENVFDYFDSNNIFRLQILSSDDSTMTAFSDDFEGLELVFDRFPKLSELWLFNAWVKNERNFSFWLH